VAVALLPVAAAWLLWTAGAQAASGAAHKLVETYSPIVMLRAQEDPPCDRSGEQYQPTTVDVVLGNPDVRLIAPQGADPSRTPMHAPTTADIAGLGKRHHLDLPGNPLEPGCTYARDFAGIKADGEAPAITYAHIRRQPDAAGLVVQYWFFYYFNQFNDLHESDWEGMQLVFESDRSRDALEEGPSEIGLFQHGGGERADWESEKVEKDGTHPVVYPAAGSHATFYEQAVYIENGKRGSGVGCDNSSPPSRRLPLEPLLVPTHPAPGSRFEWLTYKGRWGQRESGFNNGPTGPNTKLQWREPFQTMENMRSSSAKLPGHTILGPTITDAFCTAVAEVSRFMNLAAETRAGAIALGVAGLLLFVVPAVLTRWRPTAVVPLRQRRAFGQLLAAGARLYGRHSPTLVLLGLTSIPILGAVAGLRLALHELTGEGDITESIGAAGFHLAYHGSIAAVGSLVGFAIVAGAVITFVRELERGLGIGFVGAYRGALRRFWRLIGAHILSTVLVLLIALTVVGIPYAIKKYVDWQFVQQEIVFKAASLGDSFRGSSGAVRGHWWHTLSVAGFLWLLSQVAGPVLGFALVFADVPLTTINLFGSLIFALLIPYVAVTRTLLYFDLGARAQEAPGGPDVARRRSSPRRWGLRPAPR
jgi:hypothetical protein